MEQYFNTVGQSGKYNDLFLCKKGDVKQIVIFFPGDVQECYNDMLLRRDTRYKDFCYENSLEWIEEVYEKSCVVLVKPARMHLNTFACYDNFMSTNKFGVPSYNSDTIDAWLHLRTLLENLFCKVFQESKEWDNLPIHLVSFSKGCVVLNQLVLQLKLLVEDIKSEHLLRNIHSVCWLDSGVPGNNGAYPTNEDCLQIVAEKIPNIEIHTTPYQMKDTLRVWIGKEKELFVQLLCKYKAVFKDCSYFDDEAVSLDTHFALLRSFGR